MPTDKLIRNCELRYAFECPTRWVELPEGSEPTLRACAVCNQRVRLCETPAEVAAAQNVGERIATSASHKSEPRISMAQLRKAQAVRRKGGRIGYHLIKIGAIEESKLTEFLSKQYGVPAINLKEFAIEPEIIKLVPRELAEEHHVIPVKLAGATLILAMTDPSDLFAIDDVKFLAGCDIEVVVASEVAIREAIARYY